MADNKPYYYMRLKEYFFDSDELVIIESMENGYMYSNILLKMYLKSLKRDGKLMLAEDIPYTTEILSKVIHHNVSDVEKALDLFESLGLIERIKSSGAIFMANIQNYIGKSSTEADRQRSYQRRIQEERNKSNSNHCKEPSEISNTCKESNENCKESCKEPSEISTPERETERELNSERELNTEGESEREGSSVSQTTRDDAYMTIQYNNGRSEYNISFDDYSYYKTLNKGNIVYLLTEIKDHIESGQVKVSHNGDVHDYIIEQLKGA
ncbi:phage replisome organizer N-terminal domain-containing protein [Anaerostipes sp.]|uniref:phage replisome organizer N-terminal domain-containing protein n=1 Tax=Anaerostipes sp. TaxID=1872530 RepID=UPI0025C72C1E|nr:phage replisome organizer N-terminal domain-containing protein [Anaerostipes sp.]MBS7008470.1 phage replisome organizer N-terminal domain-containing protein [Anaerostipes sp.]